MVIKPTSIWNIWPFVPFPIIIYFYFTLCFKAAYSYQGVPNGVQCKLFSGLLKGWEGIPSREVPFPGVQAVFIAVGAYIQLKVANKLSKHQENYLYDTERTKNKNQVSF